MEEDLLEWIPEETNPSKKDKLIQELNELKRLFLKTHMDTYIGFYIRKLMVSTSIIDIKPYLLENIDTSVINIMIDLNITPNYQTQKVIFNDQQLFEEYILCGGTNILKLAPDEVYNFTIKGKPLIEYLFENNIADVTMIDSLIGCPQIFKYIKQYKKEELLKAMNPNDLLERRGNALLLDDLIASGIKPELSRIYSKQIIYEILYREAYYLLESVADSELTMKYEGEILFEYLLKKGVVCKEAINSINYGYSKAETFVKIIIQNKRLDLLLDINEHVLNQLKYRDKTLLEHLYEAGYVPNETKYTSVQTLSIIIKQGKYKELQKCSEKLLLVKLQSGRTVVEEILRRGLTINLDNIKNEEVAYYIYINKRKDLYPKIQLSTLLMEYDEKYTYLDWIIIEMKQNSSVKIKDIREDKSSVENKAKIYIIFAKHKIHNKYSLTKEDLLMVENGQTLLQYLLDENEDITLNELVSEEVKQEKEIALIIKIHKLKNKIDQGNFAIKEIRDNYLLELINSYNDKETTDDESILLEMLYDTMNDGKSDPKMLHVLIALYTHLFATKNIYANEITSLIEIKRNNPDFHLGTIEEGAYFSPQNSCIEMSTLNPDELTHEIGHMINHFLGDKKVSQEFIILIEKLRSDPSFLERTARNSKEYHKLRNQVAEYVEKTFMKEYDKYQTPQRIEEIRTFIESTKELEDSLGFYNFMFNKVTAEKYLRQDREIKKQYFTSLIMRLEYGYVLSISDILDAVHLGKYQYGKLKDKDGNEIIGCAGHGEDYYSRGIEWIFDEMIANYSEIVKSSNPQEGLKLLREYAGDELTNLLESYYNKCVFYNQKYSQNRSI